MLHSTTVPGHQTWFWDACWSPVGWMLAGRALDKLRSASLRPAHLPSTSQPVGLSVDLTVEILSGFTSLQQVDHLVVQMYVHVARYASRNTSNLIGLDL